MKEKGFTLIELLAVIVILAIIALIATPIVLNIIEDSKKSAFVQTGNGIVDAAEYYYMKEMSDGVKPTENKVFTFNGSTSGLEELEFDGEIPKEGTLTVDVNGNIELVAHNNQYCIMKEFETSEITIKEFDGNCGVLSASICTLISDTDNSGTVTAGDKYQCKVKDDMEEGFEDGYYFYVLSHNYDENDNTKIVSTNLIMDRNIYYNSEIDTGASTNEKKGLIGWYAAAEDSSYGPVTAMDYLYNATKKWTNIPDMIMNYEDEQKVSENEIESDIGLTVEDYGYGNIITTTNGITKITMKDRTETATYNNLKARMPYLSEVSDYNADINNAYLYDNLSINCLDQNVNNVDCSVAYFKAGVFDDKITHMSINGYWLLSSSEWDGARIVYYQGKVNGDATSSPSIGVRPVITLKI